MLEKALLIVLVALAVIGGAAYLGQQLKISLEHSAWRIDCAAEKDPKLCFELKDLAHGHVTEN